VEYVATFSSTHKVLKAEKLLKERAVPFKLYPSPKALIAPSQCGLVIACDEESLAVMEETLAEGKTKPRAIYRKCSEGEYVKV